MRISIMLNPMDPADKHAIEVFQGLLSELQVSSNNNETLKSPDNESLSGIKFDAPVSPSSPAMSTDVNPDITFDTLKELMLKRIRESEVNRIYCQYVLRSYGIKNLSALPKESYTAFYDFLLNQIDNPNVKTLEYKTSRIPDAQQREEYWLKNKASNAI